MDSPVTNTKHRLRFHALGDFTKRDQFGAGYRMTSPISELFRMFQAKLRTCDEVWRMFVPLRNEHTACEESS
jgi:hypothetical protein